MLSRKDNLLFLIPIAYLRLVKLGPNSTWAQEAGSRTNTPRKWAGFKFRTALARGDRIPDLI